MCYVDQRRHQSSVIDFNCTTQMVQPDNTAKTAEFGTMDLLNYSKETMVFSRALIARAMR